MNPELKLERIRLDVGAERPFTALHISDNHLCYADERDDLRKNELAARRTRDFGFTHPEEFEALLNAQADYARDNRMMLIHTGDLIDFVSRSNLDAARRFADKYECLFIDGNHEFSKYVGEAFEDEAYLQDSLADVERAFGRDVRYVSMIKNGVNFVGIDDVYYHFRPDTIDRLEAERAKGLPIVLCMHVPLYTPRLYHGEMVEHKSGSGACLTAAPAELVATYNEHRRIQQLPTKYDIRVAKYIDECPDIRAVLTGHLHHPYTDTLPSGKPQIAVGCGYMGFANVIEFV